MLQLGIVLALLSALAANLGFLYKHRGANEVPDVDVRHPIRTGLGLWRSRWFAAGMLVGAVGWAFHTAAISIAPMSVVQVVLAGGIVLVAVLADRFFGIAVGRRQWMGLVLTGVGLAMLVLAMPAVHTAHSTFSVAALALFEGALLSFGVLLILGGRHERGAHLQGPLLGAAPWVPLAVGASVLAYYISARSLQEGGAVEVISITATGANVVGILGGFVVFGDPIATDTLGIVVQVTAFCMVVLAAALLPAPRAASSPVPAAAHMP
jgi:drug/metabolite transporter (DMT)-like permease